MHFVAALYCLLASSAVNAQQGKLVTLEMRAKPFSRPLPELSKAIGTTLLDSPQTAKDVLLIKVKDVPAAELLDHIASTLNATWKQEGASLRLVRTTEQIPRRANALICELKQWP